MTNQEINSNNKLIAEFIGGEYDYHGQPNKYWENVTS